MLSSKEIYNKNAKGFSSKGVVNKQQNSSDTRTTEQLRTAIKKKFSGNVVLGSRLVLPHPHDDCKWICHRPRLQSTSDSHQNQRICRFLSGGDLGVGVIVVPSRFFCKLKTESTPRFETFEIFDFNVRQNLLCSNVFSLNHGS